MAVLAIFTYEVKPGRMEDFMAKLARAAGPQFQSAAMPRSVRLFRNTVPGPDTGSVILIIEYEDMAAYGARPPSRTTAGSGRICSRVGSTRRRDWFRSNC
jgi:hypothetical protein